MLVINAFTHTHTHTHTYTHTHTHADIYTQYTTTNILARAKLSK